MGLQSVSRDDTPSVRCDRLDSEQLSGLAAHPLSCIGTEYQQYQGSVDSSGVVAPSERHPVLYGCFDWHSAVYGYGSLCR